jgi:hypothetical protein
LSFGSVWNLWRYPWIEIAWIDLAVPSTYSFFRGSACDVSRRWIEWTIFRIIFPERLDREIEYDWMDAGHGPGGSHDFQSFMGKVQSLKRGLNESQIAIRWLNRWQLDSQRSH